MRIRSADELQAQPLSSVGDKYDYELPTEPARRLEHGSSRRQRPGAGRPDVR